MNRYDMFVGVSCRMKSWIKFWYRTIIINKYTLNDSIQDISTKLGRDVPVTPTS